MRSYFRLQLADTIVRSIEGVNSRMAATKKSTKKKTTKTKSKTTKKAADPVVSEVSKEVNKTRASKKGIVAIIAGILILALVAAATLGERNQEFSQLTKYQNNSFSVLYPDDWSFEESESGIEFYSDDAPRSSAAGLAILDTGKIAGYGGLEKIQRDELINLALESVREDEDTILNGFSDVANSEVSLSEHPSANRALSFEIAGTLKGGGDGVLRGFMIIAETGDTFIISAGGNKEVVDVNEAVMQQMLESFQVTEASEEDS